VVLAWAANRYNPAWNFKANAHPRCSRLDARRPKSFEREVSNLLLVRALARSCSYAFPAPIRFRFVSSFPLPDEILALSFLHT